MLPLYAIASSTT
ncbi:BnaC01g42550D [Brassica napus]|uniref:BnaC01g42550D protein n=3 Tax=Brassica napus TaxID=3708 RepID=A0A078IM97_BRANA|nr:BnaC01g42550D [Brassica napus]